MENGVTNVALGSGIWSKYTIAVAGTNPFYFQDYGGGWYMADTSWLRTYGSKSVWTGSGVLGSSGGLTVGYGEIHLHPAEQS